MTDTTNMAVEVPAATPALASPTATAGKGGILNDFQKLMFSTNPEDVIAVKRQRAMGLNLADAINTVIVERNGGISGSKKLARAA